MPRVRFTHPANVLDVSYAPGVEADLDDEAAKDVVKSKVGVIVAPEVRTAEDKVAAAARKAVSRREA